MFNTEFQSESFIKLPPILFTKSKQFLNFETYNLHYLITYTHNNN